MLTPLLAGYALAGLAVGVLFLIALVAVAHLVFRLLADAFGHDDPARRRRGRWSFDAGVVVFAAGFLGTLSLFVADDAATEATGLGYGDLLYGGVGTIVVGGLAMAVGIALALDGER